MQQQSGQSAIPAAAAAELRDRRRYLLAEIRAIDNLFACWDIPVDAATPQLPALMLLPAPAPLPKWSPERIAMLQEGIPVGVPVPAMVVRLNATPGAPVTLGDVSDEVARHGLLFPALGAAERRKHWSRIERAETPIPWARAIEAMRRLARDIDEGWRARKADRQAAGQPDRTPAPVGQELSVGEPGPFRGAPGAIGAGPGHPSAEAEEAEQPLAPPPVVDQPSPPEIVTPPPPAAQPAPKVAAPLPEPPRPMPAREIVEPPKPRPAPPPRRNSATDQMIAEHIARKGVTRCPTAIVGETTGVVAEEERKRIAAHSSLMETLRSDDSTSRGPHKGRVRWTEKRRRRAGAGVEAGEPIPFIHQALAAMPGGDVPPIDQIIPMAMMMRSRRRAVTKGKAA